MKNRKTKIQLNWDNTTEVLPDWDTVPVVDWINEEIPKFALELDKVCRIYYFDDFNNPLTLKHLNAQMQSKIPGPYKIYVNTTGILDIRFDFDSPKDKTWFYLKWS